MMQPENMKILLTSNVKNADNNRQTGRKSLIYDDDELWVLCCDTL